MTLRHVATLCLALAVSAAAGCGGSDSEVRKQGFSHVRLLTSLHTRVTSSLGRYPKDEAEFKAALVQDNVSPEALKVNSIDDLFISERDGQPLVVVYGQPPAGSDLVVYEQTGVNGMRQVGHRIGVIEEVDAAKFAEIAPKTAAK
ncbi:hypothetical protein [Lacipirellula limnantheis]|uniref:Uncharacterized protein n=1 Tax=Lacipirellula limnantheis TaxID=2528024 RepID=A0A517U4H1_9BACT|nr:hypothetical protein [Lacipirellula limnantheis]QDT75518.1 hypothetical protein I41_47290 [Lacipirellula limnantheis]